MPVFARIAIPFVQRAVDIAIGDIGFRLLGTTPLTFGTTPLLYDNSHDAATLYKKAILTLILSFEFRPCISRLLRPLVFAKLLICRLRL